MKNPNAVRLFIETDILDEDELDSARHRICSMWRKKDKIIHPDDVFQHVISRAWHEPEAAWKAVLASDEIYACSSLVPICGYGTYTGAPVVFDRMIKKVVEDDIRGKALFFMRPYRDIEWRGIDWKPLDKAFTHNKLYTLEHYQDYGFLPVDMAKLIYEIKKSR